MKIYPTEDIRNLALVGHAGAGKTMLAEAMLAVGGVINRLGRIGSSKALFTLRRA
jgi:elongation factor G